MKKGIIIGIIIIGLIVLICGILIVNKKGHELYSTIYYFGLGNRRVKIYENGDVYDDLEIEEPNHKIDYKFVKRLSKEQLNRLKSKLKDTSDDNELQEYVIESVYGVKEFDNFGNYNTNDISNNSNKSGAEKKTLTGWKILTIDKGYYESETIEKDLDGDNVNETIDIKKTGKYITINGKDYITNKYYTGEDNSDSSNTSSQSMLLDEYNVNQYNFIDLNEDGVMEIIHRTFSMMISPIRSKYTIYNYVDNNLKEVGEFSIIGNMPNEVYVKNNLLKFEYDVYESNSKEEVKIELSV